MNNIEVFRDYYNEQKKELELLMKDYNEKLIVEDNPIIREYLEYFADLNSDGKLIRGILVNLGYHLLNNDSNYSGYLALAYEVFQTAILVHDDLIDKDDKRRGKKTVHCRNTEKYNSYISDREEISHFSNSIGICIGDYGLYAANKIVTDNYMNDSRLGIVLNYFNSIVLSTIKGEILDIVVPIREKYQLEDNTKLEEHIMNISRLKTSYYTIVGPLASGLLLAGADSKMVDDISEFGEKVGIAFQIQDDILGIYSDKMGKNIGSDIKEFKQTILYSHISNTPFIEDFKTIYGREDITMEDIERVRELLRISGSLKYAEDKMNELYNDSLDVLNSITWINDNWKSILRGFVEYLRLRNK